MTTILFQNAKNNELSLCNFALAKVFVLVMAPSKVSTNAMHDSIKLLFHNFVTMVFMKATLNSAINSIINSFCLPKRCLT